MARSNRLYLLSDGVVEETGTDGEQFGRDRVHAELLATRHLPLTESVDALIDRVRAWSGGGPLSDDATVLAIERVFSTLFGADEAETVLEEPGHDEVNSPEADFVTTTPR